MKTSLSKLPVLVIIFIIGFIPKTNAQDTSIEQAYTTFYKYPREKIIAQLNKTVFLPGESIWFQAHLIDPKTSKTSDISSNVYVGVFDTNGNLIKHELIFAENGLASGNIVIDSTFAGNQFTLKMFTRWMLNFDENLDFNQQIFVVNDDLYPNTKTPSATTSFKVDYYTEGDGGLIENFINSLVYTLTDSQGNRVEISSGELIDSSGKTVLTFDENASGIGQTAFFVKPNENYLLRLNAYNGTSVETLIEPAKAQGVLMNINNTNEDKLSVGLLNNFAGNTPKEALLFDLVIEKDGYIFTKKIQLEPGKPYVLNLQKDVFTTGIYKAYLLKNEKIVLERPFFNQSEDFFVRPAISVLDTKKDSLTFQLSAAGKESFVFSASLLPDNTGSLFNRTSLTQQLFEALPQTQLDNLTKKSRAALAELDMNLLTSGRSGGNWNGKLGIPKSLDFNIEKGISFRGKIKLKNDKPLKDKIIVFNESMSFQQIIEPGKDGSFESKHNYLENGTILKVALIDSKKKLKKPDLDFFEVFPDVEEVLTAHPAQKIDEQALAVLNNYKNETPGFPLIEGEKKVTALKEVEVSAIKKEKVLEHKPAMYSEVDTKGYKVTNEEIKRFQYVTDFIRTKGYNVASSYDPVSDNPSSHPITSKRPGSKGPEVPTIYLDEMILTDVTVLFRMNMNIIDEIYIDYGALSSGIRAGNGGQGGIIYIITQKGSIGGYSEWYNPVNQVEVTVKNGFNPPENYQSPNYTDLDSPIFLKYGTLDWKASLKTDLNGQSTFVLNNKGLKKVKLLIEGLNNEGNVISWVEEIEISGQK